MALLIQALHQRMRQNFFVIHLVFGKSQHPTGDISTQVHAGVEIDNACGLTDKAHGADNLSVGVGS